MFELETQIKFKTTYIEFSFCWREVIIKDLANGFRKKAV